MDTGEKIAAEQIVVAAGALVKEIGQGLGAASMIYPVKGEAASFAAPDETITRVLRAPGAYICPKAGGRIVLGATEIENRTDLEVAPAAIEELWRGAKEAVPTAANWLETERWAGLRPATPDGAPILGRGADGPENVHFALGHHRNGVLLAPVSAKAMAAALTGAAPVIDLQPFGPDRFNNQPGERVYG